MQVCILFLTDNHARTPPLKFFTGQMPCLPPNQQRQSTEGKKCSSKYNLQNCYFCWLDYSSADISCLKHNCQYQFYLDLSSPCNTLTKWLSGLYKTWSTNLKCFRDMQHDNVNVDNLTTKVTRCYSVCTALACYSDDCKFQKLHLATSKFSNHCQSMTIQLLLHSGLFIPVVFSYASETHTHTHTPV